MARLSASEKDASLGPSASDSLWSGKRVSLAKKLDARRMHDRRDAGMGDPAFRRNGEELLDQLRRAPQHLHAVLRAGFFFQHAWRHEDATAFAAKRLQQRRIVELPDQPRPKAVFGQPEIQALAHGGRR